MASIKDLKKRIGTVKNTQQTTKAMKMVSAAKLRRAQEAIVHQRPYAREIAEMIRLLLASPDPSFLKSPYLARAEGDEQKGKRIWLVILSSDRGLCGGFNSNVIKTTQRWIDANRANYESIELVFVGRKAHDFFKNRRVKIAAYHSELGGKVSFTKAKRLSDSLVNAYLNNEVDEIKVIYNEFKNAVTQKVVVEEFLPLNVPAGAVELATQLLATDQPPPKLIVEPSPVVVLNELLSKNFSIQAFRILLESQAGEHGARMSAMENATKNAGEMIRKLTLQFNKQRQANITKELLEIISGSESQKAG